MNDTFRIEELSWTDVVKLLSEVERYLAAVDAFRAEGREPAWRSEFHSYWL